jgi:hypothetical protein
VIAGAPKDTNASIANPFIIIIIMVKNDCFCNFSLVAGFVCGSLSCVPHHVIPDEEEASN